MTGGFLGVLALVAAPFIVVDVLLVMLAAPAVVRAVTTPGVPMRLEAELVGIGAVPLAALLLILVGGAVAGRRFRAGAPAGRWLIPLVPAGIVHVASWIYFYVAQ